jgi:hypothetical protein
MENRALGSVRSLFAGSSCERVRGVSVQGVPVRECGEVIYGEQGFGEFEKCEESVCREFQ